MSAVATCLWFNGEAEEAANFYVSLFPDGRVITISRYGPGAHFPEGTALLVQFSLAGQHFQALNGGPQYSHSEAASISVRVKDAAELDHFWDALVARGGQEGRCGWLKDRFGVSWQVVPEGLGTLLGDPDPVRRGRALQAMLQMRKLDLDAMRAAADGR
jgi:predicted 3-demethylubiquinone-9 3-methyltransferase (glyoxalase superfamily)